MDPLADWLVSAGTSLGMLVRARLATPWGMRIDAHGQVMLHVVASGSCWVRAASARPQRLLQGDLAVLPHGDGHELADERATPAEPLQTVLGRPPPRPGAPSTTLLCGTYALDDHIARPMLRALPKLVVLPAEKVRAQPQLSAVLSLLTAEIDQPAPGGNVLVKHLFDTLFVYLVRAWLQEAPGRSSWLSALRDAPVSQALSRMHAEPTRDWTVESLAREAGMSRAAFARRFAQALGEPPLTYLARWRMGLAARLLVESDASIAEVASRVGYDSEFAFSRAFKRLRGQAPSAFRREAVPRRPAAVDVASLTG
ncbi:MAG TPA: AraC family transcriptional regulator [Myxococcales bacterium]|jgi:AraC family transcriptional activator of mtrCDE